MAILPHPRSVSDATRFTPTTPHAGPSSSSPFSSFPASAASAATSSTRPPASSRFQPPTSPSSSSSTQPPSPPPRRPGGPGPVGETPAQKVARLRAAHLAAKSAQVSSLDRVIERSRRLFDSAHRFTIVGLIGFTAIAGLLTAYTAVDMLRYNRRRKVEFIAAQQQMDADGLAAARLAYMRNEATPAQVALVEEARRAEAEAAQRGGDDQEKRGGGGGGGGGGGFFSVPNLLGAPAPVASDAAVAAVSTPSAETGPSPATTSSEPASGIRSWFRSGLAREEEGETPGSSQRRLGYESLSDEDDAQLGARESDVVRAIEDRQAYLATKKVQQALERERANQRQGGPLDRIGLEGAAANRGVATAADTELAKKTSWWKVW